MIAILCRSIKTRSPQLFAKRCLYVLGIESSCDDTSSAVLDDSGKILGEGHFSQARVHLETGGIIPIIAQKIHAKFIRSVVETSMTQSSLSFKELDAIAVTVKPGLVPSLKIGLEYAKDLCTLYSKPLIPIHHMEAHALTARLTDDVKFPFLCFLISGGHCILAVAESVDKFKTLGQSLHNSPGEVLDKIARRAKLKNLKKFKTLVGGAAVEAAAKGGDSSKFKVADNIFHFHKHCNFSFSPFSQVCHNVLSAEEKKYNLGPDQVLPNINDFCAAILLDLARHLCQRLEIAFHYVAMTKMLKESEKCLVLSGGVACNTFIQKAVKKLCDTYGYKFVVPPPKLCTDNGIMVAWNGIERLKENLPLVHPDNLSSVSPLPKCPLGEDISQDVIKKGKMMHIKYMVLNSYSEIDMSDESAKSTMSSE